MIVSPTSNLALFDSATTHHLCACRHPFLGFQVRFMTFSCFLFKLQTFGYVQQHHYKWNWTIWENVLLILCCNVGTQLPLSLRASPTHPWISSRSLSFQGFVGSCTFEDTTCWWKKSQTTTAWMYETMQIMEYLPYQLVSLPDFWTINSMCCFFGIFYLKGTWWCLHPNLGGGSNQKHPVKRSW